MPRNSTLNEDMTLQERWPDLYQQLCEVREAVERHFRDACEFKFTIENGKLYIQGVQRAKRTHMANLRIALQFYAEGMIGLAEAVSRIGPYDVEEFVLPSLANRRELKLLATGLPASPGAGTGQVVFSRESADVFRLRCLPYVFACIEVSPEDFGVMASSEAVLTMRGGMTSHAAVSCRGMRKPCVAGLTGLQFSNVERQMTVAGLSVDEGDWITVDGAAGTVHWGKGEFISPHWEDIPELRAVAQMIEQVLVGEATRERPVGSIWRIRDYFVHARPLRTAPTRKSPSHWDTRVRSPRLVPLDEDVLRARESLHSVSSNKISEYSEIILGLSEALSRILASRLGLGNHHRYFRPLWDPQLTTRCEEGLDGAQLVAFQYFDVNRYIHHLPDISDITFLLEVDLYSEKDGWFLDFTNPDGESLVANAVEVRACALFVNGASVHHDEIPLLYDVLRKREYYWRWFDYNMTSYEEISKFLCQGKHTFQTTSRLAVYCEELGLIEDGELTATGLSLIGKLIGVRPYGFFTK